MLKQMLICVLLVVVLTACGSSPEESQVSEVSQEPEEAQESDESLTRILIIGDSYVENHGGMDKQLVGLADSNQSSGPVEGKSISEGGAPLSRHWNQGTAVKTIQDESWTVVVLQGDVALEGVAENGEYDKEKFFEHVRLFHEEIQNSGAEAILLMHWENHTMKTEEIAVAHYEIAEELGVKVAPAGLAWERSMAQRPELNLYAPDGSHANLEGEYLTVAVLYATIFGDSPEGFPYYPDDIYRGGNISQENAEFLQKIAWETVREYSDGYE